MVRTTAVVLTMVALLAGGAWAQAPAGLAQQRATPAQAGPRFVDADGDGVCDNFAARGGFGRGAGRFAGAGAGRMGGGGFGVGGGFAFGPNGLSLVDVVARTTGQDRLAVQASLRSGKTLAQIGEASGKSIHDLAEAVMAERAPAVREAVSGGRLSASQAEQVLAWMRVNVESNLTGSWQGRGRGMGACPWCGGTAGAAVTR